MRHKNSAIAAIGRAAGLRQRYRMLKVHFNAGPHWWIKPVFDTSGERAEVRGITFIGEAKIPAPYTVSHCAFRSAP